MKSAVLLAEETVIFLSIVQSALIFLTPATTPEISARRNVAYEFFCLRNFLGAKATIGATYMAANGVIHSFVRGSHLSTRWSPRYINDTV